MEKMFLSYWKSVPISEKKDFPWAMKTYFTAQGYYNIIREMPSGKGFADFIFIPRSNAGWRPAMVVELKYNRTADTAIRQIKEKRYQGALTGYSDKILLVGINYDAEGKDKKHHTCVIEEWNG